MYQYRYEDEIKYARIQIEEREGWRDTGSKYHSLQITAQNVYFFERY